MRETGCPGLVHWDDPEGWDGEGGGWGIQDAGILSLQERKPSGGAEKSEMGAGWCGCSGSRVLGFWCCDLLLKQQASQVR